MNTQKTVSPDPGSENTDPVRIRALVTADVKTAIALCHLIATNESVAAAIVVALNAKRPPTYQEVQKDAKYSGALLSIIANTPAIFEYVSEGVAGLHQNAVNKQKLEVQRKEELLN